MSLLFIVDDDQEFCSLLSEYLRREHYHPAVFFSAQQALTACKKSPPSLIILDLMMPGMDGLEFLTRLRKIQQTPVIILTARGDDVDSIVGLELGADDYLAKPFNPKVLMARIRAILRRREVKQDANLLYPMVQTLGHIVLHRGKRAAYIQDKALPLTSTEYSLLEYLVRELGRVVSKEELYELVLGKSYQKNDRGLDMHISNLRSKLNDDGRQIITVRGSGYQWALD